MKRKQGKAMFYLIVIAALVLVGVAVASEPSVPVNQVRDRWAQISYQTPKAQREAALVALSRQAAQTRQAAQKGTASWRERG